MPDSPIRQQQMMAEGQRQFASGDAAGAAATFERLVKQSPNNPMLLYLLGSCLMTLGRTAEARKWLQRAIEKDPGDVGARHDLALVHKREGRYEEAHGVLDEALRIKPGDASLLGAKAGVHQMTGDYQRAYETLLPALAPDGAHISTAMIFAKVCPRLEKQGEAAELLRTCLKREDLAAPIRCDALFRLGDVLDSAGRWDEAFEAYRAANELKVARYSAPAHAAAVDTMIGSWTREVIRGLPRGPVRTERPLFIIGMPRSGTSLVEQILASHPKVFGGGELNDLGRAVFDLQGPVGGGVPLLIDPRLATRGAVERLERSYLETLRRLSSTATRVTDKMPQNFLHLGLIAAVFPRARVIHCVRDAMDTCLSCYFQNFGGNIPFAYDLSNVGRFYKDYERLMAHWKSVVELPILDVVYEDLVGDQEAVSRRMVEFAGLEWDPACLAFHESGRVTRTAIN